MANRVVIGAFDGSYVLRVTKPGHNALDPNVPSTGMVYDSRWATFATIRQDGRLVIPYNWDAPVTYTIWHGSGFVPFVIWAIIGVPNTTFPSPAGSGGHVEVRVDAHNIHVTDRYGIGLDFRYFVTRTRV